ncbi:MAG: hypothetical protein ISEC1_P1678 [Thiomicrorhabdus sp.]|nr:MAG: hypothetical protein ISEC1_P1678 [Thiomicrorhabdus sp.]
MKDAGIITKIPKKLYYSTEIEKPNISNLLKIQFNQDIANIHWISDITFIQNHQGWS